MTSRRTEPTNKAGHEVARYLVLEAVVHELRQSFGRVAQDRDGALVRMIMRTGLSRSEIEESATELLALVRALGRELRQSEA